MLSGFRNSGHPEEVARMDMGKRCMLALLGAWLVVSTTAFAQAPDQAQMILNSARKGYNEKNFSFAVTRFREFLAKFGGHKDAAAARYGLALALLETPEKNYAEVRDLLQGLAGNKDWPEHPHILYHLGLALRGVGVSELALADAKPQEAGPRRAAAQQRFEEALKQFDMARVAFSARLPEVSAKTKVLPPEWEWAARARCDQTEMQLRLQKLKDAQTTAVLFVRDPVLTLSRYRDLGRYYHGFASFLLKDYAQAEPTLSLLAPFADPVFGTHARYLLARTHHLADERAEAGLHYEGVLADHAKNVKDAQLQLKRPELKNDPVEKARCEALVNGPAPDHVARATFYSGVLLYEGGKFADAKARFAQFPKQYPNSILRPEAELRLGFCMVQLKEFGEAMKTLSPLVEKEKRLADQVLLWIGKARAGAADPASFQAYHQALSDAIGTFKQAADRAQQMAAQDPEAKERRGEILLEMADTFQLIKQSKDAAATYNQILAENLLPAREEETFQRLVTALHLAGDYNESDKACGRFVEKFPMSTLLPAVLFRNAENSYFRTLAADKNPNPAERAKELARLSGETVKRYQHVIDKYPEFQQINVARFGLGMTYYRQGELDKARQTWAGIPGPERNNELAVVPYLMADCLLRQAPAGIPEDALAVGKLEDQLKTAAELLDQFAGAQPGSPQTPDALLKLGLCQQRLASLMGQPAERNKLLQAAQATYERMLGKEYQKLLAKGQTGNALQPQAYLERAKCVAQLGNPNGAIDGLKGFAQDPLRKTSVAPMALLQLATLLRAQNKSAEAAGVLAKTREEHEPALSKDPARAHWVALLRYHHGVALREGGKLPEARAVFESVLKQAPGRPEAAESALRLGQCLKEEGQHKIEAARKQQSTAKKPEDHAAVQKLQTEGFKNIAAAAAFLEGQAEQWKKEQPIHEARARMLYEAAWAYRELAEPEIQAARAQIAQELHKKLGPAASKLPPPDVPLAQLPLQPGEKKARALYQALLAGFPDLPLASEVRFELAEHMVQRKEFDGALQLLNEGLDREPPQELTEKLRIQIGVVHAAKGNLKGALAQFDAIAANPKSSLVGHAHYRAAEVLMQNQQYGEAIARLVNFRDKQPLQNIPGLTDRAFLRLGHAYAHQKNWEESRKAHERVVAGFPSSPWLDEARYGMAWALQQQRQYDPAINLYSQVTARTATDVAAKAQLQIGLCRLEQKKYAEAVAALLVVPHTYDYPEYSAVALLEAARAHAESNQNELAIRLLERLIRDHPQSRWAEAARDRLQVLKGS
jgi:TolA-binding protein